LIFKSPSAPGLHIGLKGIFVSVKQAELKGLIDENSGIAIEFIEILSA